MADYRVYRARIGSCAKVEFGGWRTVDLRTRIMVGEFASHREAWDAALWMVARDNLVKMSRPIPGDRLGIRVPGVYRRVIPRFVWSGSKVMVDVDELAGGRGPESSKGDVGSSAMSQFWANTMLPLDRI